MLLSHRINRQQNRPNASEDTPRDFWKSNTYLPFVNHILSELQTRLLQAHGRYYAQYLISQQVAQLSDAKIREPHAEFLPDIDADIEVFSREVKHWRIKWTDVRLTGKSDF